MSRFCEQASHIPAPWRDFVVFMVFPLLGERFSRYLSCPGSWERDLVAIYSVRAHCDDIRLSLGSRCCRYLQCSPVGTGWSGQGGWHQMLHKSSEPTSGIQQKNACQNITQAILGLDPQADQCYSTKNAKTYVFYQRKWNAPSRES